MADDINGKVHAVDYHAGHAVTLNVFNWSGDDWLGAESVNVIPDTPCAACVGGAYFQAVFDGGAHANTIIEFPLSDFFGHGGGVLVNSESIPGHGTALVEFDGTNYVTTTFDTEVGRQEGASFVDCDIPSPTPTATRLTATATATATPTRQPQQHRQQHLLFLPTDNRLLEKSPQCLASE